jgi:hypothetical protein
VRNLDQLKGRFVHRGLVFLVSVPVAIRFLDDDIALEQEPLDYLGDVELGVVGIAHAQGNILEIAKQGHILRFRPIRHVRVPSANRVCVRVSP